MTMQHIFNRWAETQFADHATCVFHRCESDGDCPTPDLCRLAASPAHAASEYVDEPGRRGWAAMTLRDQAVWIAPLAWPIGLIALLFTAHLIATYWQRIAALLGA